MAGRGHEKYYWSNDFHQNKFNWKQQLDLLGKILT